MKTLDEELADIFGPSQENGAPREEGRVSGRDVVAPATWQLPLAPRAFPLFRVGKSSDEVAAELAVDPAKIRALFDDWVRLTRIAGQWGASRSSVAAPQFNHESNEDGSCCPAHRVLRRGH